MTGFLPLASRPSSLLCPSWKEGQRPGVGNYWEGRGASLIPSPALSEVAAPWTDETVKQCLYLYLALLPQNHKLIHELAAVYTEAIADIKRTVLRVIEQPVRPLSSPGPAHRGWG